MATIVPRSNDAETTSTKPSQTEFSQNTSETQRQAASNGDGDEGDMPEEPKGQRSERSALGTDDDSDNDSMRPELDEDSGSSVE